MRISKIKGILAFLSFLIICGFVAKKPETAGSYQSLTTALSAEKFDLSAAPAPQMSGHGRIKILSQNIGGGTFRIASWWPFSIEPLCTLYKLCDKGVSQRVHQLILDTKPDVIFFQEAMNLEQLTTGYKDNAAILPPEYKATCSPGAGGMHEVCIAWNTQRATAESECTAVFAPESGALSCRLKIEGTTIQMVSTHPSAWDENDRQTVMKAMWSKLIDRKGPVILAGDFNTETGTVGFDDSVPYPAEFGTLFGRHVKGYGRDKPTDSFFGFVQKDKSQKWENIATTSTVLWEKLDHVFTNFGTRAETVSKQEMPCESWVCLGNKNGFDWGPAEWTFFSSWGAKVDHLPILALITW